MEYYPVFCYVNLNSNNVEIGRWQNGKKQYKTLWVNLTLISVFFTKLTGIVFTFICSKMSTRLLHPLEFFATLWTRKWFAVTVFVLVCSKISGVRFWIRTLTTLVLFLVVGYQMCVEFTFSFKTFSTTLTSYSNALYISSLKHWTDCIRSPSFFDIMLQKKRKLTSSSNTLKINSFENWTDCLRSPSFFDVMLQKKINCNIIFKYIKNQLIWKLDWFSPDCLF